MSNLARQHFIGFAEALAESYPIDGNPDKHDTWLQVAQEITNTCAAYNTNFDRYRFEEHIRLAIPAHFRPKTLDLL